MSLLISLAQGIGLLATSVHCRHQRLNANTLRHGHLRPRNSICSTLCSFHAGDCHVYHVLQQASMPSRNWTLLFLKGSVPGPQVSQTTSTLGWRADTWPQEAQASSISILSRPSGYRYGMRSTKQQRRSQRKTSSVNKSRSRLHALRTQLALKAVAPWTGRRTGQSISHSALTGLETVQILGCSNVSNVVGGERRLTPVAIWPKVSQRCAQVSDKSLSILSAFHSRSGSATTATHFSNRSNFST
jgi:hypothetical protein